MTFAPYSGSLLRLAVTTAAIVAIFAAALASWQHHAETAHRPGPGFGISVQTGR